MVGFKEQIRDSIKSLGQVQGYHASQTMLIISSLDSNDDARKLVVGKMGLTEVESV